MGPYVRPKRPNFPYPLSTYVKTRTLALKSPMTPIFFLNPLHPCHGGIDRPPGTPGTPGTPIRPPQTAIHTPKATQFSLSTFNVGKDPSSRPKIANDTHLFSQPMSSMPWGRRSAIWDPGGPYQTLTTAIHTPI